MDAEEHEIYNFLKMQKEEFISAREICRRAGAKKLFRDDPEWAKPVLLRMVDRGILDTDGGDHYRLKPPKQAERMQRWIAPGIAEALRKSGKKFDSLIMSDSQMDDYYDSL